MWERFSSTTIIYFTFKQKVACTTKSFISLYFIGRLLSVLCRVRLEQCPPLGMTHFSCFHSELSFGTVFPGSDFPNLLKSETTAALLKCSPLSLTRVDFK